MTASIRLLEVSEDLAMSLVHFYYILATSHLYPRCSLLARVLFRWFLELFPRCLLDLPACSRSGITRSSPTSGVFLASSPCVLRTFRGCFQRAPARSLSGNGLEITRKVAEDCLRLGSRPDLGYLVPGYISE